MNTLFYGDNLDVLRRHVADESVDLVYLDPPFKSNQDYNVLFQEQDGSRSASQIRAFEDTWQWDQSAAAAFEEVVEAGGQVSLAMQAFRTVLGESDMLAYLSMMAPRLKELHRVLKPTGSIYLHCDCTASHYLKMLMDSVFDFRNFRNEVLWYYYNKMHDRRKKMFAKANDTLLFYVKDVDADFTFRQLKEKRETPFKQLRRKKVAGKMVNVKDEEGHCLYTIKEDRTIDNVSRLPCLQPAASEKLGYPTQKPEALLGRIISASSGEGDTVLDPFCGCGTALAVAQRLNRQWIGIDITQAGIVVIKQRLRDAFPDGLAYKVIGEPTSLPDAAALAAADPYQFQWWALGLVNARRTEEKKGADRGIDGRLFFHDEPESGKTKQVIISVKAGNSGPAHVRDLRGVVDREKAAIGLLITMEAPTAPMRKEAASAGFYESPWGTKHPHIQILTVGELLEGKTLDAPPSRDIRTFKKAPRAPRKPRDSQREIFD